MTKGGDAAERTITWRIPWVAFKTMVVHGDAEWDHGDTFYDAP